jgi:hypothetical protein
MDFPRILNCFPYFLFLIATTPILFASQTNEGKKERNGFFWFCLCMLASLFYVIASQISFLTFLKNNSLNFSFWWQKTDPAKQAG